MKLTEVLSPDAIVTELVSTTKAGVLEELLEVMERASGLQLKEQLLRALEEREARHYRDRRRGRHPPWQAKGCKGHDGRLWKK